MEAMMGLEDPVDFIEDQDLSATQKFKKLPRMLLTLLRLMWSFRRMDRLVEQFLQQFESIVRTQDRALIDGLDFSGLMRLNEELRLSIQERWHIPIVNDFYVMMSTGKLRRSLEHLGFKNALQLQNHLLAGEPGIESTEPTKILVRLADEIRAIPALKQALLAADDNQVVKLLSNHSEHFCSTVIPYRAVW